MYITSIDFINILKETLGVTNNNWETFLQLLFLLSTRNIAS